MYRRSAFVNGSSLVFRGRLTWFMSSGLGNFLNTSIDITDKQLKGMCITGHVVHLCLGVNTDPMSALGIFSGI